jgi:hypothetical protein
MHWDVCGDMYRLGQSHLAILLAGLHVLFMQDLTNLSNRTRMSGDSNKSDLGKYDQDGDTIVREANRAPRCNQSY